MPTITYLKTLIAGINAKQGTQNCAHCALRFDKHVAEGKNLALGSVPVSDAGLLTKPLFEGGKIIRSTSQDKRLLERCSTPPSDYRLLCSLEDEDKPQYTIDLTTNPSAPEQVHFYKATEQDIAQQLLSLFRRKKDGTAYGFILLTDEKRMQTGHMINFYIDKEDKIYFIDAQRQKEEEQITTRLDLKGYRKEIFYIPSIPPEGFALKAEKTERTDTVADKTQNDETGISSNESTKKSILSDAELKRVLEATKTNPTSVDNWINLGRHYRSTNNYQEAFTCYQKATQLDEKNAIAWNNFGICYQNGEGIERNPGEAFTCYQKATQVDEKDANANAWNNLGNCYRNGIGTKRNPGEAFKCYQKGKQLDEKHANILYNLGNCYQSGIGTERNPGEAFKCYQKVTQLDEKNAFAWSYLGNCYLNGIGTGRNHAEALKCYTKANLLNPSLPVPSLFQLKPPSPPSPVVAAPAAPAVVASLVTPAPAPLNQPASSEVGLLVIQDQSNESTKKSSLTLSDAAFKAALEETKMNPTSIDNWKKLANHHRSTNAHQAAFKCYQKIVELDEKNGFAWNNIGACYQNGDGIELNPGEAFKCYQKAKRFDDKDAIAWNNLGNCYKNAVGTERNTIEAFKCFQKARECDRKNEIALHNIGECYRFGIGTERNPVASFNCYEYVILLNEKYAPSWISLGYCYEVGFGIDNNPAEAFKCYQKATQFDEKNALAWVSVANCYQNGVGTQPNPVEASKCYEKAKQLGYILPQLSVSTVPAPAVAAPAVAAPATVAPRVVLSPAVAPPVAVLPDPAAVPAPLIFSSPQSYSLSREAALLVMRESRNSIAKKEMC